MRATPVEDATSLLLGVAWADPHDAPAGVRLLCLLAAERLQGFAGQSPDPIETVDGADIEAAIRDALAALAQLPADVFEQVVQAAADARHALQLCTHGDISS